MNEHVIDAADATAKAEADRGEAELGDSRRRSAPGAKIFFMLVIILGILLCGFLVWQAVVVKGNKTAAVEHKKESTEKLGSPMHKLRKPDAAVVATDSSPSKAAPIKPDQPQALPVTTNNGQPPPLTPAQLLRQRRLGSGLTAKADGGGSGGGNSGSQGSTADAQASAQPAGHNPSQTSASGPSPGSQRGGPASQQESWDQLLAPVTLNSESAGQVGPQDFLLLQGSMIPCALVTRIDSGLPGMLSCDITRDIYSANGRTVVLDRGTRVTGQYQNGLQQGQNRLFVVWSRAVTPQGVIIRLDSPGADQLGASGFGGQVNNHFWKRFGSAILLSLIEDAGQYAVASQSNGGTTVQLGNTGQASQNLANTTLQRSINIPPTLTKPNGDLISIYVARDLNFGSIYALRAAH